MPTPDVRMSLRICTSTPSQTDGACPPLMRAGESRMNPKWVDEVSGLSKKQKPRTAGESNGTERRLSTWPSEPEWPFLPLTQCVEIFALFGEISAHFHSILRLASALIRLMNFMQHIDFKDLRMRTPKKSVKLVHYLLDAGGLVFDLLCREVRGKGTDGHPKPTKC